MNCKSQNLLIILRPQNAKKHDFGYPKNGTSGAQKQNLTPDLESVTKTDSKTGFRFEF